MKSTILSLVHTTAWVGVSVFTLCLASCSQNSDSEQQQIQANSTASNESVAQNSSAATSHEVIPGSDSKMASGVDQGPSTRDSNPVDYESSETKTDFQELVLSDKVESIATSASQEWADSAQQTMNPANDGWDTELFAEQASAQEKHLGKLLLMAELPSLEEAASIVANNFSCTALRPADRQEVFRDENVLVQRSTPQQVEVAHHGPQGLIDALSELTTSLSDATDKHFKFKLFRVTPAGDRVETTSYFEISGLVEETAIQRTSTWNCEWAPSESNGPPKLLSVKIEDYEEVVVSNSHQTLFSDVSESAFRNISDYKQQFQYGVDHWRARLENYFGIFFDGLHGLALADVNADGLDDLYVCEPGGLPNRLFLQTADGLVRDASEKSGINFLNPSRSALFIDLDNDGDQDCILPFKGEVLFFANDGTGKFARKQRIPVKGQIAYSLAAADYDQDGRLDVYACYYHGLSEDESNRLPAPIPLHDARTGGPNHLFRNLGNWKFQDITNEVGLDHNNDRWSYAAAWEDYDNDGDLDLYVANDFGRNNLYRQDQGKFSDVAAQANAEDMNFGMSATFGDYDRNGFMDLYVSNMFSAAGGRITFQPEFQNEGQEQVKSAFQQMVRGNTLLKNNGDGTFSDVTSSAKVSMGRWAWGSLFADVNNDGWDDLLVANGFVTGTLPGDL